MSGELNDYRMAVSMAQHRFHEDERFNIDKYGADKNRSRIFYRQPMP